MEKLNKLQIINVQDVNKSEVFIAIDSPSWRFPYKISLENLIDNISIDPHTLKIEVPAQHFITPNVFSEKFIDQNILYYKPPRDASILTGVHMCIDDNYLYIWVENRWKRAQLSQW